MYENPYVQEELLEETEDASLVKTCHLCGKAQCGQRKGRVRCACCKRIFCLQQLYKKFKIKASVDDKNFKCPRCTGICCCVCNCQRPPPHVHCKVYKVRQNKKKPLTPVGPDVPISTVSTDPGNMLSQIHIDPHNLQPAQTFTPVPIVPSLPSQQDNEVSVLGDPVSNSFSPYTPEVPGSKLF